MDYQCVCRTCKRQYKSANDLDLDGYGYCDEHKEKVKKIAISVQETIDKRKANGYSPKVSVPIPPKRDWDGIMGDYRREKEKRAKYFI